MVPINTCALMVADGRLRLDILERLLADLAHTQEISYFTKFVIPTVDEAGEGSAWLSMMRLIAIQASPNGVSVVLHSYSSSRTLIAVVCRERVSAPAHMGELFEKARAEICQETNARSITFGVPRAASAIGLPVEINGFNTTWNGGSSADAEFVAFVTAALVCQHLLTGHSKVGIDVLLPGRGGKNASGICGLNATVSAESTLNNIQDQVYRALHLQNASGFSSEAQNTAVLAPMEPGPQNWRLEGADWTITLLTIRPIGPWRIRLTLPAPSYPARVECIGIFSPATVLLPKLYQVARTEPQRPIGSLVHLLESQGTAIISASDGTSGPDLPSGKANLVAKPKQITVASLTFGDLPYAAHSRAINQAYCTRHGYSYRSISPPSAVERHPVWYKVKGVQELLEGSDFVLFIDADAYFYDHDRTIESLIEEHMGTSALMLGTDRRDQGFAFSDEDGNTGVFIVRNCPEGFALLAEWWNAPLRDIGSEALWRWPVEQSVFNDHVRKCDHSDSIRLIHYAWMNGRDGTFIRHLVGTPEEDRLAVLRDARATLGLSPKTLAPGETRYQS